jgi:hypothetical protein
MDRLVYRNGVPGVEENGKFFPVISGGQNPFLSAFSTHTGIAEEFVQPLYDRVHYPVAGTTASYSFFSVPLGGNATLLRAGVATAISKTMRDTNLATAGVIPSKAYAIIGISIAFISGNETISTNINDIHEIVGGSWFKFTIVDKDILTAPTLVLGDLYPVTTSTATGAIGHSTGGGAPMFKFPKPVLLKPNTSFSFSLNVDGTVAIATILDIYIFLHCHMRRQS